MVISKPIQKSYRILLIICCSVSLAAGAQSDTIDIRGNRYITRSRTVKNEWGTRDKVNYLYRIGKNGPVNLLKYYAYKDDGGDCNNLFWYKEKMSVAGNSFVFLTHYFQKTNLDPLPVWRKQIFRVGHKGQLFLVYDKYKYRDGGWVDKIR